MPFYNKIGPYFAVDDGAIDGLFSLGDPIPLDEDVAAGLFRMDFPFEEE